jgi:hypothetical protein
MMFLTRTDGRFEKKTWTNVFVKEKFSTVDIFSVDWPFWQNTNLACYPTWAFNFAVYWCYTKLSWLNLEKTIGGGGGGAPILHSQWKGTKS